MNDNQYETVAILAKLIRKAHLYNAGQLGSVLAVPVADISEVLEKFVTTQTIPTPPKQEVEK